MSSLTIIYITTVFVSIIIAILLMFLSRTIGSPNSNSTEGSKENIDLSKSVNKEDFLKNRIYKTINQVVSSRTRCRDVSTRISDLFTKELNERLGANKESAEKEFSDIKKNADIAWNNYKKVLTDQKETEIVMRSIAEGLVVVDSRDDIIMMNPAAEDLLGVTRKERIGKSISGSLKEEAMVTLIEDSPTTKKKEVKIITHNEDLKKVLRSSNAVIEDENGKTVGIISVPNDITKQKKLDKLKLDFLSNVTHELRTPLAVTQNAVTLLRNKEKDNVSVDVEKEFFSIAERNLKKLGSLIDDLLDFSKLESGRMELKREIIPIENILNEVTESLNTWAMTKSIKIRKNIQENIPKISIDPKRIGQVLNNLIGNAIKFTPKNGTITVEAKFEPVKNGIKISIRDTGIGIEKDDLPKIFDRFYQTGERTSADINGTGLGLSISKDIIELHGGEIWAESEKGLGTCFTFRLRSAQN